MVEASLDNPMPVWTTATFSEASHYRARYYDPQIGRFISEDATSFDSGIDFYGYVRNHPSNFTDPSGLYQLGDKVPPLNPRLDRFMKCMDKCTGDDQYITATTNGRHSDPGHAAGTTVDLRPIGTPSKKVFCCAGNCGASFGLDERKIHTPKGDGGLHYHLQLVPPLHPDPINLLECFPVFPFFRYEE